MVQKNAKKPEAVKFKAPPPKGVTALTRDEILTSDDIKEKWVEVPEWGGSVLIRGLDGVGRDAFERSIIQGKGEDREVVWINMRAKLVQRTAIDPVDRLMLFSEQDVMALGRKSGAALQKCFEVAARLSGITSEDQKKLVDNLEAAGSGDSPSDSPSPSEEPDESSSSQ